MADGYDVAGLVLAIVPVSLLISMLFWLWKLVVSRQPPGRWKEIGAALAEARAHAERLRKGGYITEEVRDVFAELDRFDKEHNDLWLAVDQWKAHGLARLGHPSRVSLLCWCSDLQRRIGVLRDHLRKHTPGAVSTESVNDAGSSRGTLGCSATPQLSTHIASSSSGSLSPHGTPSVSGPHLSATLTTGDAVESKPGTCLQSVDDPGASHTPHGGTAKHHASSTASATAEFLLPLAGDVGTTKELGLRPMRPSYSEQSLQAQEHSPMPPSEFEHTPDRPLSPSTVQSTPIAAATEHTLAGTDVVDLLERDITDGSRLSENIRDTTSTSISEASIETENIGTSILVPPANGARIGDSDRGLKQRKPYTTEQERLRDGYRMTTEQIRQYRAQMTALHKRRPYTTEQEEGVSQIESGGRE